MSGALLTAAGTLAGCTTVSPPGPAPKQAEPPPEPSFAHMYRAMPEERFPIPAVDLSKVNSKFYRRLVEDPTGEMPGTIVVDTRSFYLYLVRPGG